MSDILIPTDAELKNMEEDPNFVGYGKVKHSVKHVFRKLEITCVYHGDATNPLAQDNHHRHAVKLKWTDKKTSAVVPFWPRPGLEKITTEKEILDTLSRILNGAKIGALDADSFCNLYDLDDQTIRAEISYKMYRVTYKQVNRLMTLSKVDEFLRELKKAGI